jgi:transposase
MRIIGCDLHARQQTLAMLDTVTGEVVNRTLQHEGNEVRKFYSELPRPALVGIEAIGPMQWFLNLLEELNINCQVGGATKIRAAEPRKQKHDRRDAELILKLLVEKRFPAIWRPSKELLDLRALLLHCHHWVRLRTQVQNALQAIALASYVGLILREYSSGTHQRLGALTKQGSPFLRFLWNEVGALAMRRDPELQRFYRRKLVQKGLGKVSVAAARKLGIRLWIMLRDQIDYEEFCRRGQKQSGAACAGMLEVGNGANRHRPVD